MKNIKKPDDRRIVLGTVSRATEGGVYGTIEGAGLRETGIQLS